MRWVDKTIGGMLDESVGNWPDREAVIYHDTRVTYAELQRKVNELGKGLMKLGIEQGDKVAILMPNYPEWVYSNLAISKIGAITVPINIRFKSREIDYVLRHSGAKCIILADHFLNNQYCDMLYGLYPEIYGEQSGHLALSSLPCLKNIICLNSAEGMLVFDDVLNEGARSDLDRTLTQRQAAVRADDVVNMFYTSGTTGAPKGALATHNVLMNIANYNELMKITPDDVLQVPAPLFYTTANYWGMLSGLMSGAKVCLCTLFTPEERLTQIEKERVTVTIGAPSVWISTMDYLKGHTCNTSSLRVVWTGGGPISRSHVNTIKASICDCVVMVYGMTETAGITTLTKLDDPPDVVANTIGLPLPYFQLKIIDRTTGKVLPEGKAGELCVRGKYVIKGYLNMPGEEETQYFDGEGWYHTGDVMVKNENGYYSYVGRAKEVIKVGGERVGLYEVDSFVKTHPKVKMAATIGIPHASKQEVPMVFVETVDGEALTELEVIDYCKRGMAVFKVPHYVRFISDWPLAGIGKVQRFKLWEMVKDEFKKD